MTGPVLSRSGMWGLVNNAGISTFGEVEFTSMETYKDGRLSTYADAAQ